jgi:acyl-CoA thioesterase FadM
VRIAVAVEKVGTSSCALRFEVERVAASGPTPAAVVRHVVVAANVDALRSTPIPDEIRAILARHTSDGV